MYFDPARSRRGSERVRDGERAVETDSERGEGVAECDEYVGGAEWGESGECGGGGYVEGEEGGV